MAALGSAQGFLDIKQTSPVGAGSAIWLAECDSALNELSNNGLLGGLFRLFGAMSPGVFLVV
jgi:hypothetical protein